MIGKPPETVPDNLTGEEYYQLGTWYLDLGQIEQGRISLQRATEQNVDLEAAKRAKIMLACRMPATEIPKEAVERCDKVRMTGFSNPAEAARTYEEMISQYPKFERPYKRLAELRLTEGNVAKCVELLESVLKINPNYAPAMDVMAHALAANMDYDNAFRFLQQAIDLIPETERAQLLDFRRSLQIAAAMES